MRLTTSSPENTDLSFSNGVVVTLAMPSTASADGPAAGASKPRALILGDASGEEAGTAILSSIAKCF